MDQKVEAWELIFGTDLILTCTQISILRFGRDGASPPECRAMVCCHRLLFFMACRMWPHLWCTVEANREDSWDVIDSDAIMHAVESHAHRGDCGGLS